MSSLALYSLYFYYLILVLFKYSDLISLRYSVFKTVNTYDWIHATAISSDINKIIPNITMASLIVDKDTICEPINLNNKWPATMLAANRTDNVRGRITLLIDSINTITGINGPGVPRGTRCAITLLNWLKIAHSKLPSHRGRANDSVKIKCLLPVNTYGTRPMVLVNKIYIKTVANIKIFPWMSPLPSTALNSSFSISIRLVSVIIIWDLVHQ